MNPEQEIERLNICLLLQQQCTNSAVADLAAARLRIRELERELQSTVRPDVPAGKP